MLWFVLASCVAVIGGLYWYARNRRATLEDQLWFRWIK